jgi:hypothetical protein
MTTAEDASFPRQAIADAGLVFAVATPVAYALQRLYEQMRGETSDPVLILVTLHTVYYWRVGIAVWLGGMAAVLAYAFVARRRRATDQLPRRVAVAAAVLLPAMAVVSYLFP